jgi:hypothetical protein
VSQWLNGKKFLFNRYLTNTKVSEKRAYLRWLWRFGYKNFLSSKSPDNEINSQNISLGLTYAFRGNAM